MKLCLKGKTVGLVICQIIKYKLWKISNYTARDTVQGQEMSMCTGGAGKRDNSYSTWYMNKGNTNVCLAIMKGNWFSFQFVWNFQQSFRRSLFLSATRDWSAKDELLQIDPNCHAEKAPLYFDVTSNDTVNYMWTHPVVISSWRNTTMWVCWW